MERKINRNADSSIINGICLMAHHITTNYLSGTPSTCQCTLDTFRSRIQQYEEDGYSFVHMSEAFRIIEERNSKKFAILSFDDVPDDMYTNAYPFLKANHIPFTLFLARDRVGMPGYLSLRQIKELQKDGLCTIGSHSMSHTMLRYSKDKIYEIVESKTEIEALLGVSVDYFAYPYGSVYAVDIQSRNIAMRYYKAAFSTLYGDINDSSSRCKWFLPRKFLQ